MSESRPLKKTGRRWLKYFTLAIVAIIFMVLAVLIPAYLESNRRGEEDQRRVTTESSKQQ